MAPRKIVVSFAARYAAYRYLGQPHKDLTMLDISQGLEILEALDLPFVQKWLDGKVDKTVPKAERVGVSYSEVLAVKDHNVTCRVDEVYLTWLSNGLDAHRWGEVIVQGPKGLDVIPVSVEPGLWQCIGLLKRAVTRALLDKTLEIGEEESKKE